MAIGLLNRHLANCHAFYGGQHVVGDYENGNLYVSDLDCYTDHGLPIIRIRQTPHVSSELNRIFYKLFELDMQFGVGQSSTDDNNALNPHVVLQMSNDGGQTWSNELQANIGAMGRYRTRARWHRLGSSRDRLFRIIVSDPVPVQILSAHLDIEVGNA
jgi:hypothetical protein